MAQKSTAPTQDVQRSLIKHRSLTVTQMNMKLIRKWGSLSVLRDFMNLNGVIVSTQRLLHNGPDTMEELLERHIVKKEKSLDDDEAELLTRRRLTSNRREALSLYRDIPRATRFSVWADPKGVVWRDILRANARKEF